jgi:hypothetical protein
MSAPRNARAALPLSPPRTFVRFVHDLVRDAVEAGLGTPSRVRLHRRAAAAVEAAAGGRVEVCLADLASRPLR